MVKSTTVVLMNLKGTDDCVWYGHTKHKNASTRGEKKTVSHCHNQRNISNDEVNGLTMDV